MRKISSGAIDRLRDFFAFRELDEQWIMEQRVLRLFLLLRILMLGFFSGLQSGIFLDTVSQVDSRFRLFAFGVIIITLFQFAALRRFRSAKILAPVQLSIDILLLTYVLANTSNSSSFVFYLVLIVCASLVTNAFSALFLSALSGLCYALLITGIISSDVTHVKVASTVEIITSYFALVLSALVAALYARRMEHLRKSYTEQSLRLERVASQQSQLMNSLSEGVITLDVHSAITGVNDAAQAILGLSADKAFNVIGRDVGHALRSLGLEDVDAIRGLAGEASCEIRLRKDDQESVLRCTSFDINQETDDLAGSLRGQANNGGKILFISDVSELKSMESRLEFHEKMTRLLGTVDDPEGHEKDDNIVAIVGKSSALKEVRNLLSKVGPSDAPVLILGESGTGKELVAQALHRLSGRKKGSFVPVNCGAIPETLIESELFGHKKGAFTGATHDTRGLFREAEGGTLFLDEIGELPMHLQAKLLRVLQDRVVRPVGASTEIPVNVRVVAATNKNLKEEVRAGRFREDLYYRLRVVEMMIPPLRARKDDIPLLVVHFLERDGVRVGDGSCISPEAMALLMRYDYPGNIRELENIVARSRVLGGGVVLPENLPEEVRLYKRSHTHLPDDNHLSKEQAMGGFDPCFPVQLERILESLERRYLLAALESTGGKKKEAARLLGLNFRSFRYRLKKYDMAEGDNDLEVGAS